MLCLKCARRRLRGDARPGCCTQPELSEIDRLRMKSDQAVAEAVVADLALKNREAAPVDLAAEKAFQARQLAMREWRKKNVARINERRRRRHKEKRQAALVAEPAVSLETERRREIARSAAANRRISGC